MFALSVRGHFHGRQADMGSPENPNSKPHMSLNPYQLFRSMAQNGIKNIVPKDGETGNVAIAQENGRHSRRRGYHRALSRDELILYVCELPVNFESDSR